MHGPPTLELIYQSKELEHRDRRQKVFQIHNARISTRRSAAERTTTVAAGAQKSQLDELERAHQAGTRRVAGGVRTTPGSDASDHRRNRPSASQTAQERLSARRS